MTKNEVAWFFSDLWCNLRCRCTGGLAGAVVALTLSVRVRQRVMLSPGHTRTNMRRMGVMETTGEARHWLSVGETIKTVGRNCHAWGLWGLQVRLRMGSCVELCMGVKRYESQCIP